MADVPATNIDTTGVVGNASAIPLGSQFTDGSNKDSTEIGAGGSATARPGPPLVTGTLDTEAVYGPNLPSAYTPTSTLISGTRDTTVSSGAANVSNPVYRAPNLAGTPASTVDTENALGYTAAVPTDNFPWVTGGTLETPYLGAPSGAIVSQTDTRTIDHTTPTAVSSKQGVIGAASSLVVVDNGQVFTVSAEAHTIDQTTPFTLTHAGVTTLAAGLTIVNNGQIIAVTAESHTIDLTTPFTLTHAGVTTAAASLVVKKGASTLVYNTDYTVTPTGSGATANYTIVRLNTAATSNGDTVTVGYSYGNTAHFTPATLVNVTDYAATPTGSGATANFSIVRNSSSTACANGDSVAVSYQYGNAKHFTPGTLALTTDYTVTFSATGEGQRTFTILRNNSSSAAADGDSVAITYQYGNAAYWGTHDPTAVPPAPTIGSCVALDRSVKVVWTAPTLSATDDIDGYVIISDTGGTRYVPGQYTQFLFQELVPGTPVTFAVAAFNEAGLGQFSAFSSAVTPLNYDEVPTGSLDPRNTVNYIYNSDGSTVAGTGLGPSGIVPGGDYPW